MSLKFPYYKQLNAMDCGPTCLKMVAQYYGKYFNISTIRNLSGFNKEGVSLLGISEAAENIGFRTRGVKLTFEQLLGEAPLPCILYWDHYHFVVLQPGRHRKFGIPKITIVDPAKGFISFNKDEFMPYWANVGYYDDKKIGIALLLEPTSRFYELSEEKKNIVSWGQALHYLRNTKWSLIQVFIALLITSLLQLMVPFLTQSIVDTGINSRNLQFITIVLLAQIMLLFSRTIIDFIRTRILLKVSSLVNMSILADFWIKITKLPISYFECHHTGDTLQRIGDNRQIQQFLTGNSLTILFSLFNFVIYSFVLAYYSTELFLIFTAGSIIYFCWVRVFFRVRRKINYQSFHLGAAENSATLQLIQGIHEIKLNNAERQKRWEWEGIQASIFKLSFRNLTYSQVQQAGALFINQGKDLLITFLVASLVIEGKLTLGALLAVQYIIGQLSSPIEQFVGFAQNIQDARISMERLNEVHAIKEEDDPDKNYVNTLPKVGNIRFKNLSFKYPGAGNENVLQNINIDIQEGKVTAIVGPSGSGKTTILKLLLKYYDSFQGDIRVGNANFKYIGAAPWRSQCGAVLQDGYIFNDSIARNIGIGDEIPEIEKLTHACELSQILPFIESLPNGFNTKLGAEGIGISQGQKQRLLIARVIYKNPKYLFFDEATNALDANNERAIVEGLQELFKGRTVVIVAHRLSTVKHADKIVVLSDGLIVEQGTHYELSQNKGAYYNLVKNQLELGK